MKLVINRDCKTCVSTFREENEEETRRQSKQRPASSSLSLSASLIVILIFSWSQELIEDNRKRETKNKGLSWNKKSNQSIHSSSLFSTSFGSSFSVHRLFIFLHFHCQDADRKSLFLLINRKRGTGESNNKKWVIVGFVISARKDRNKERSRRSGRQKNESEREINITKRRNLTPLLLIYIGLLLILDHHHNL